MKTRFGSSTLLPALALALALGAGIALLFGVASAGQKNPLATPAVGRAFTPSPIIFPDQTVPLRMFHDRHLAQEIECITCHDAAESSIVSGDVLVPVGAEGEELCSNCHDLSSGSEGDPKSGCVDCHFDGYEPKFPDGADSTDTSKALVRPAAIEIPVPNLKFNHKVHTQKGIACSRCHGALTDVQVATRDNALPSMNTCLQCHDGRTAPSECRTCHLVQPDGRLVTEFEQGTLKPSGQIRNDAHDDRWLQAHSMTAKGDEAYCASCHEPKFCLDCHNGVLRPLKIHPNNWVLTHPVSARRNTPNCSSCHRSQRFCMECHKRMNVASAAELQQGGTTQGFPARLASFHPAGWVGGTDGRTENNVARGPNHHSFHAQRNIRQCASCHTERTCAACHGAGSTSLRINPHPPAFGRSGKCRALRATNERMCAKCHGEAVPSCL